MTDRLDEGPDQRQGGFLPPEPAGPEPELGPKPSPAPPEPQQHPAPPGWAQPPPAQGWVQPTYQQGWGYAPPQPDNGPAVTGFVLAMVSIGLWLFSAGMSSLLSLGLAIGGLVASRRGRRNVSSGHTRKHNGLAQAGFWCSIAMIGLATLSTIFWAIFWIAFATDEDFRRDLENDDDNSPFGGEGISTSLRAGVLVVRLASSLLS